jgi:molecular chaperone GrpE (heat shock protein)
MEEEAPELADQTVTKELQRGYLYRTRLLRPAMVVVARSSNKPASPSVDISA